jgi:hypothetical protein
MSVTISILCPDNFEPKAIAVPCCNDSECYFCNGDGETWTNELEQVEMNLSNANFSAFASYVGMYVDCCGETSLAEAKRHLIRGMNTSSAPFTEEPSHTKRPGKAAFINCGRSEEQMKGYVERFGKLLAKAEEAGAKMIIWD